MYNNNVIETFIIQCLKVLIFQKYCNCSNNLYVLFVTTGINQKSTCTLKRVGTDNPGGYVGHIARLHGQCDVQLRG